MGDCAIIYIQYNLCKFPAVRSITSQINPELIKRTKAAVVLLPLLLQIQKKGHARTSAGFRYTLVLKS